MRMIHLLKSARATRCLAACLCLTSLAPAGASEASVPENPFHRFFGEWTLKDDRWNHNWGQGEEQIKISNHHTVSKPLNTGNTVLSVVDKTNPRGHILWSYNRATQQVHHLSSFGAARNGVGVGTVSDQGDLRLKVTFEDEPGTYRIYTYTWVSDDEYEMLSTQFDQTDQPTGRFYRGTFVRIHKDDARERDVSAIKAILENIDDNDADLATKLRVYADDVVHMGMNQEIITNKADLGRHLEETKKYGRADMKHEIVEVFPYDDFVLMRGQVTGTFYPADGGASSKFRTKNLFVFRRYDDGSLKVWKVIFNFSPNT